MKSGALVLLSVLLVRDAAPLVVTVTHAAGRMGVSVVGQLREIGRIQAEKSSSNDDELLDIRAVVRSESEASRLKLDLCGAVLRNGELRPLLDLKDDLGIDLYIVEDDSHEIEGLANAFEGADVAVLLSAAHADFTPATVASVGPKSSSLLPTSLLPTSLAASAAGVNVRVPPLSGAAAARRLGAEISLASTCVRHVLLRSSMGVGALRCASHKEASDYTQQLAAAAVMRMGGGATIAAQADAEDALRARCVQRGVPFTVLRLGALVDSAGGIPLTFGSGDAQLLERCADGVALEPPLISRNDAARLVVDVVRRGLLQLGNATVDVAWQDKWGMSSAGTEEASRCAGRQDLVGAAVGACAAAEISRSVWEDKWGTAPPFSK